MKKVGFALAAAGLAIGGYFVYDALMGPSLREDPRENAPESVFALAEFRIRSARASSVWENTLAPAGSEEALNRAETECGYAWSQDLETVIALGMEVGGIPHIAFIVRGNFDTDKLKSCATSMSSTARPTQVAGLSAMESRGYFFAPVRGGFIVAQEAALVEIVETIRGERPSVAESNTMDLFEGLPGDAQLRAVVRVTDSVRARIDVPEQLGALPDSLAASLHFTNQVTLHGTAPMESSEAAQAYATQLNTIRSEFQSSFAGRLAGLVGPARLLNELELSAEGSSLVVSADYEGAAVVQLFQLIAQSIRTGR